MTISTKFSFRDAAGVQHADAEVSVDDYAAAQAQGLSLTQHLNRKFGTDESRYGSVISQALASNGLSLKSDHSMGIQSSSMKDVMNMGVQAGAITSPDGKANNTAAGRIFFPEVILQTIAANLTADKGDFFAGYESLLSGTENVNAPEFKRARIDVTAPEASESQSTAQLAEPAAMVSITAANQTQAIPSKGIGLMISDQALANTSIDLVNTIMGRQAYGERVRMVESQLSDVINGNSDLGMTALSSVAASTFDSASVDLSTFSHKAWIKYLRANYQTMSISNIVCDLDTALAIEARIGKPVIVGDNPNSPRIDSLFSIDNLGLTPPRVFLVDSAIVPTGTIVGLDNKWALRRYVNVSASFEAIESFILRRAKGFRVDSGEALTRLYDDAFSVVTM